LLITVGAPIIALVYRSMSAGAMRRSIATQEKAGDLMTVAAENFQAQQVVKAFSLKAREMARFDRAGSESFDAEMSMTLFNGWFMVSVQSVMSGLQIGVMALGAWLIIDGNLSIGAFVAFLTVMGQVLSPVAGLTALGQQLQQAMGAMVRVQEVMDSVPEVASTDQAQPVARLAKGITFEHVGFGYTSERRVLDDVTIQFPAGTRTAIVGPSGSGKSSILQLALRTYDPDDGSVRWDGSDLRNLSLDELRANIGVVFQDTFAFNDSIRENIRLGKLDASDADVEQAARQAELHDFVTGLPQGYDTFIGERGGMLSGGQRQRLAIARALLRNPSLLVLDEATSALDPRTERIIAGTLDRVSQGRTTIAVTHRLATVTNYDQIVMVVDGTITERGTHLELLSLRGQYADLWAEQAGTPVAASTAELTPPSGGRRLTRMTGNFKAATSALPPPLPPSTATDAAGRATRTFTAIR
jgi:ATP-binding cassette subfamily B protein